MIVIWQFIEMLQPAPHFVIIFICKMIAKICIVSLLNCAFINAQMISAGWRCILHCAYWKWRAASDFISIQMLLFSNYCVKQEHTVWAWIIDGIWYADQLSCVAEWFQHHYAFTRDTFRCIIDFGWELEMNARNKVLVP